MAKPAVDRRLQRVVARVPGRDEVREGSPARIDSSERSHRASGGTGKPSKSVARVYRGAGDRTAFKGVLLHLRQQMNPARAHVTNRENCSLHQFSLDAQVVLDHIWRGVVVVVKTRA